MSETMHTGVFDPALRHLLEVQTQCEEKGVDDSVRQGVEKAIKLMQDRENFCEAVSTQPSDALKRIIKETSTHPFGEAFKAGKTTWDLKPAMLLGALEGDFLQSFVSASKATRVLDIGMFLGFSALACAEVLPPDGKVVTCEYDPYLESVARELFKDSPHGNKIEIRLGSADDTLEALAKEKQQFDVIFIDANKDGYIGYYKIIMKSGLLAAGGSILMDNALFYGTAYMPEGDWGLYKDMGPHVVQCTEFIQAQTDIHRVLLPLRDGIWIIRRKADMKG